MKNFLPLTAIIIDDEPDAIDVLQDILAKDCPQISVLATANSVDKGIELIESRPPDILFLDVQMPGRNGFDLLNSIDSSLFHTIFTSAHENYAIEAVKFHAMDYLLKPIRPLLLKESLERVENKIKTKQLADYKGLLNNLQNTSSKRIAIPTGKGYKYFKRDQIIRVEAARNYSNVCLVDEKPILVTKNLKQFELFLSKHGFIRVHNAHLINPDHIVEFDKTNRGTIILSDQKIITLGPSYRGDVIDFIFSNSDRIE